LTLVPNLTLEELAAYHEDIVASLRLYFSSAAPTFTTRFTGLSLDEVDVELTRRLDESELRSAFALLTSLEASFRIDFDSRCRQRLKDDLSIFFREVEKTRGDRVRLDEDILEGWKRYTSAETILINQLRGAFNFRHWLAHGRYWTPKLGREYDFGFVYTMTSAIVSGFPFES
jgi:hypothetical protein